jgi:hypothetical protein
MEVNGSSVGLTSAKKIALYPPVGSQARSDYHSRYKGKTVF